MTAVIRRYWFPVVVAALVLVLIGGLVFWWRIGKGLLPIVNRAPDFTMQSVENQPVEFYKLAGKIRILDFMYTDCPDVCPLTTASLVKVQNELKKDNLFGSQVEVVAVSLDPERDTKQAIQSYEQKMGIDPSGWVFLHGTPDILQQVEKDYKVQSQPGPNGTIAHTMQSLWLIDGQNNLRKVYSIGSELPVDDLESDIQKVLHEDTPPV